MKCPYCNKPVSTMSLLTQIGGARPCAACGREFLVTYDWKVAIATVLAGFVLTTLGFTFLTSREPAGEVVGIAAAAILTVAAIVAARAEKKNEG